MLVILIVYSSEPKSVFARGAIQAQESILVTQEIRYHLPEAGEVFLVWGINGWNVVPKEMRPTGTIVKGDLMYTPMNLEGDTFVAKVQAPSGAEINYGFFITKNSNGVAIKFASGVSQAVWDGDYHTIATRQDDVIEVETTLALVQVKNSSNILDFALYLFVAVGILYGLWLLISLSSWTPWGVKKGTLLFIANVIPIVIVLFIAEIYLRTLGFQPHVRTFPGDYQNDSGTAEWAQHDPFLGWTSNKNDSEINPQGFRDKRDFNTIDLDSDKIRVMVLGDSFMWGAGVSAEENIANLLQTKLKDNYEVFNLSVPGWGVDQMYLAYQQYKDIIEPDIVIFAFIDDDVNRVLDACRIWEGLNKPSFAIRNGELVSQTSVSTGQRFLNNIMGKSTFFSLIMQEIYLITDARPIVNHIFLDLAQETERRQAKFVVVRVPSQDHFNATSRINHRLYNFEGMLKGTNALYLEPSTEITQIPNWDVDLYLDDGHMSAMGNQYLADYIYKYVFQKMKQPTRLSSRNAMQAQKPLPVTQEIRYHLPEAGEVFLVWGINGWVLVPEEDRPAGTVVKDAVMHTPMVRQGDTFVAKVRVPSGATIDYGFLITKTRSGAAIEVWDANGGQDYHTTAAKDGVVEVKTTLTLEQDQAPASVSDAGLPLLVGLAVVFGMGTILIVRRDSTTDFKVSPRRQRLIYLRDLLRELVARDMKLRYKRSVLGVAWSLLNPLSQMLVFVFLFRRVLPLDVPNYPSFVFIGVLAWSWFQAALSLATGAITDNRELIRRPGFPTAILPVVTVTTNLIHFLLALPVPLLFLVLGGGRLTSAILTLPLVIVLQFLLILGLGYLVATIHVTFRDTQHLLGVFLMLLFYLTPVFYDASIIPERYQTLYRLNPMFHLITAYRAILIQGNLPDLRALLALAVIVGGLLWLGHTVFTRASYRFVEEL